MKPLFKTSTALGHFGPRFVNPLLVVVGLVIAVDPIVLASLVATYNGRPNRGGRPSYSSTPSRGSRPSSFQHDQ